MFGKVRDEEMVLNDAGKMIQSEWLELKKRFLNIELYEYAIMPNHFHGILEIVTLEKRQPYDKGKFLERGQPQGIAPTMPNVGVPLVGTHITDIQTINTQPEKNKTVGDMMDAFKSITRVEYIRGVKNKGWLPFNGKLWQRNYYEHIIRDGDRIANYIIDNPKNWDQDDLYR